MYTRGSLLKSVNRGFPYLARGCVVILAMVLVVTAQLSASTIRSAASIPAAFTETVDRANKQDRLPVHRDTVSLPVQRPVKLPVACNSYLSLRSLSIEANRNSVVVCA